ncbi:membrane-spanning 4-domains subfamily A member 6E isoform X2 [Saimiri boliviensis]|uniref:membrane-spanning 4-domains subfamily A member 6E isoform X2 n=1 Tax=Saimiri boliviensis TaxID=27679 RepID=UPI003D77F59B
MTSQSVPDETIIVLPSNDTNFSQAEKPKPTNQRQDSLKKRLQAKVKVIGIIQISCGMKVLSLGIILASVSFSPNFTQVISTLLKSAYPFIGPLLVHSSLAGSILSTLSALVGFSILSVNLAALNPASLQCEWDKNYALDVASRRFLYYEYYESPYTMDCCHREKASLAGTLSLMLICTVVEFCLAVLTAVLRWIQTKSDFPGVCCSCLTVTLINRRVLKDDS